MIPYALLVSAWQPAETKIWRVFHELLSLNILLDMRLKFIQKIMNALSETIITNCALLSSFVLR